MEVLLFIVSVFAVGHLSGFLVAWRQWGAQGKAESADRRCGTCRYCFPISEQTKHLMHKEYTDRSCCLMSRGATVPVGYNGSTISVVRESSFCDQWKEKESDG